MKTPVEYINRRGKTFFIHSGKTKSGSRKFYCSTKKEGEIVADIPRGYEFYENPNAQVFLRRRQHRIIFKYEIALVEKELHKHREPIDSKIDVKKNIVTIYAVDQDVKSLRELVRSYYRNDQDLETFIERETTYTPVLRFILDDEEARLFVAERFCFMGSIDDWIWIGGPDSLGSLVTRFVRHVGRQSFFDLPHIDEEG
jgi:hypothetical protein